MRTRAATPGEFATEDPDSRPACEHRGQRKGSLGRTRRCSGILWFRDQKCGQQLESQPTVRTRRLTSKHFAATKPNSRATLAHQRLLNGSLCSTRLCSRILFSFRPYLLQVPHAIARRQRHIRRNANKTTITANDNQCCFMLQFYYCCCVLQSTAAACCSLSCKLSLSVFIIGSARTHIRAAYCIQYDYLYLCTQCKKYIHVLVLTQCI